MPRTIAGLLFCLRIMWPGDTTSAQEDIAPALRDVSKSLFRVGCAVPTRILRGEEPRTLSLAMRQFDSVTAENAMKWESLHPKPEVYAFEDADRLVELAKQHDQFVVGHTLVWHRQTPDWVFQGERGQLADRGALVERLRDHIQSVVSRYRGRVHGWDVVNEALDDDGSLRNTRWLEIIGPEYVAMAFQFAHEADPNAKLYYNDYSLMVPNKRAAAIRIVRQLKDRGIPVDGIGVQGHWGLDNPTPHEIERMIVELGAVCPTMITELDLDVLPSAAIDGDLDGQGKTEPRLDPFVDGLPDAMQRTLAERYATIFRIFVQHHPLIDRVTFWGIHDGTSWRNDNPIEGRTNYPLLFDRQRNPKPCHVAVYNVLSKAHRK